MKKTTIVTGATSGIGFSTAKALAKKGYRVILVGRSEEKGQQAADEIKALTGEAPPFYRADLSSQDEIRRLADAIVNQHPTIDVLVNNAGTWFSKHTMTPDGVEMVFAVNHLAYFLLGHLLYPALSKSGAGRIVNVGSDSHFQVKGINFDDIHLEKKYHGLRSYAQSKLANVMYTYEFERRKPDEKVSIYCVQPGLVKTDIGVKHTTWLHRLAWKFRRSGGVTPDDGARTSIFLADEPKVQDKSGLYWDDCAPKPSSEASYEAEDASRLWDLCESMTGIEDYFSR